MTATASVVPVLGTMEAAAVEAVDSVIMAVTQLTEALVDLADLVLIMDMVMVTVVDLLLAKD